MSVSSAHSTEIVTWPCPAIRRVESYNPCVCGGKRGKVAQVSPALDMGSKRFHVISQRLCFLICKMLLHKFVACLSLIYICKYPACGLAHSTNSRNHNCLLPIFLALVKSITASIELFPSLHFPSFLF